MYEILPDNLDEKHLACVLLVDVSASMNSNGSIEKLNRALCEFGEVLEDDPQTSGCTDVCVISFGTDVQTVVSFRPISEYQAPELQAGGSCVMNEAIITGLDTLEKRKQLYRELGVPYYRPWVFLLANSSSTDTDLTDAAKQRLQNTEKTLNFFPMSVGKDADCQLLKEYLPSGPVYKAKKSDFVEIVSWYGPNPPCRWPYLDKANDSNNIPVPLNVIDILL